MMDKILNEKIIKAYNELQNYRSYVALVASLQRKIKNALQHSGPSQKVTAQMDANRGGYVPPAHPEAFTDLSLLAKRQGEITKLLNKIADIENGLALLSNEERTILIMKNMDRCTIEGIAEWLGYSSRQSVYTLYNRAMKKFAKNLPD